MYLKLSIWAERNFLPPPHRNTLLAWAKFGNTCRSCGGVYEDKDLLAARTKGPYFDDKPEEGMELLCSGCYVRFHTERTSGHSAPSTP